MSESADLQAGDLIVVAGRWRYTVVETRLEDHRNGPQLMVRVDHEANGTKYPQWINARRCEPVTPRLPL